MADVVAITSLDYLEVTGGVTFFLPANSPPALPFNLALLVQDCTSAFVFRGEQIIVQYTVPQQPGETSATGAIDTAARLRFKDVNLADVTYWVLGPRPACFLPDDTIDMLYLPIAALIDWLLAQATGPDGAPLFSWEGGERADRATGALALLGSSHRVREQIAVAEFWEQDGMDVRSGE